VNPASISRRAAAVGGIALAVALVFGCPPQGGGQQSHPEALVVYNANAGPDAAVIALYYASRRKVPSANLCPVSLPTGQFASVDELLGARKAIVETCICSTIPVASRPSPCSTGNLNAVRLASGITHLAIVRGMPTRLYGTPWASDGDGPSFDFYLAYTLYRSTTNVFGAGTTGVPQASYLTSDLVQQGSDGMILSAPPLSTASSLDVAYGRIEAIDRDRTFALIDRTIEAEEQGMTGNFFEERNNKDARFLRETTGAIAPVCTAYQTYTPFLPGTPESTWPHEQCRAGTTWTSSLGPDPGTTTDDPIRNVLPGTWMSLIPYAIDASLMLGSAPNPNAQAGFNDFTTLQGWRKSAPPCTTLCANHPTQEERDACAAASTDYFRQLDTSCVGGSLGLLGHQVRSYPVQYYGFFPPNWTTNADGAVEKTPPSIRSGGAFQNATFGDDRYLHFGLHAVDDPDVSTCTLEDGSVVACPERIAVDLSHRVTLAPPTAVSGSRFYVVRLRHRNAASPGGVLNASLTFEGGAAPVTKTAALALDAESSAWSTAQLFFSITQGEVASVTAITLALAADLDAGLNGFLDLDAIEVVDLNSAASHLPVAVGSFDPAAQDRTHGGDWAANAIDRLGAVAWWGSSSHHVSSGWGFSDEGRFYGSFFMGRTLGESLLLMAGGESGIVYGDPLYRPVAVRIHIPGQGGYGKTPGRTVGPADTALHLVRLEVLHGTDTPNQTQWAVESCPVLDVALCEGQWVARANGVGATSNFPIAWTTYLSNPSVAQDLLLRLRVWNPGQEAKELRNHAYFRWVP
jgi:hypothetical protein